MTKGSKPYKLHHFERQKELTCLQRGHWSIVAKNLWGSALLHLERANEICMLGKLIAQYHRVLLGLPVELWHTSRRSMRLQHRENAARLLPERDVLIRRSH